MYAVVIGDVHLRDDAFNEHRRKTLREVAQYYGQTVRRRRGVWILLGDLNHAVMRISDRNFLVALLTTLTDAGPVLIVRGNHDRRGDLDVFYELMPRVTLVYEPTVMWVDSGTVDADYPRFITHAYGAEGDVAGRINVLPYVDRKTSDVAVPEALDALITSWSEEEGHEALTVGHMNVAGALASTGQPQIGREIELSPYHVDRLAKTGPVLMGHIHKPQTVGEAMFVGSVCQQDWGEEGEEKRIAVYDTDADHAVSFSSVPGPQMRTVEVRLKGGEIPAIELGRGTSHLRVRVSYNPVHERLDVAALMKRINEAHELESVKLVGVPDEVAGVRCRAVAEATDIPSKLRAYCEANDVDWTEGLQERLDLLLRAEAAA